jgi:hypothetical protein
MTERKPRGVEFESWVDRQIREADERGAFENLPGKGKPLPGAGQPYDELWWVKDKLRREGVSYLPGTLALRKDAQLAMNAALRAETEAELRRIIEDINERITEAIRRPPDGPPLGLAPFDVARVLTQWRERRGR